MINFEEELKKFHPCPEIDDITDTIYNQDMTDMAEDLTSATDEALPQDTTVVSETEAE